MSLYTYDCYDEMYDINVKDNSKVKSSKGVKSKEKVSIYSSKHVRIQQDKKDKAKLKKTT